MPVRVGEIAGVSAPEGLLTGLEELGARRYGLSQNAIDVCLRLTLCARATPENPGLLDRDAGILRERLAAEHRQNDAARVEEGNAPAGWRTTP